MVHIFSYFLMEAFHGLGIQDAESLILIDGLLTLDGRRKRERKKKIIWPWERKLSPGLDSPCWLCSGLQLLGAIKG
jgi:hypothetical protein